MISRHFPSLSLLLLLVAPFLYGDGYSDSRRAAALAISSHKYEEALTKLAPLLKSHPGDSSLWTLQGIALDGAGHTQQSLKSFDRAILLDKTFMPALEGASQTAYLHGDARASQYVHRLLVLAPTNEVANAMAGALAYLAHDCSQSVIYFERSGDAVYQDQKALSEFADCLLKDKKIPRAVEVLTEGAKRKPDSIQIKFNLAVAELQDHNPDEAIKVLQALPNEKDSELLNLLAYAYAQADRPDDAFHTLESAIEISPSDESNYLDLAILFLEHNQENRSVLAATAGIPRVSNPASLLLIRGVAYAQLGEYAKAEDDFEGAAKLEPNQPHGTIAMSLLYSDRNQLDKEKTLLAKQLQLTPNDAVTNFLYAELLVRSGAKPGQEEFEEARRDLTTSLNARPDSAEAQVLMGKLCERVDDLPSALEHFELALKTAPDDRAALDHEFMTLRKLHRTEEAQKVLVRLKAVVNKDLKQEDATTQLRTSEPPSN